VFVGEISCTQHDEFISAISPFKHPKCLRVYPQLISYHLNRLIRPKVGIGKFTSAASCGYPFNVLIQDSVTIKVLCCDGSPAVTLFQAMGERILVTLPCNLAIRDLLELRDPFVVDISLESMDQWVLKGFHKGLIDYKCQSIYLISEHGPEAIGGLLTISLDGLIRTMYMVRTPDWSGKGAGRKSRRSMPPQLPGYNSRVPLRRTPRTGGAAREPSGRIEWQWRQKTATSIC